MRSFEAAEYYLLYRGRKHFSLDNRGNITLRYEKLPQDILDLLKPYQVELVLAHQRPFCHNRVTQKRYGFDAMYDYLDNHQGFHSDAESTSFLQTFALDLIAPTTLPSGFNNLSGTTGVDLPKLVRDEAKLSLGQYNKIHGFDYMPTRIVPQLADTATGADLGQVRPMCGTTFSGTKIDLTAAENHVNWTPLRYPNQPDPISLYEYGQNRVLKYNTWNFMVFLRINTTNTGENALYIPVARVNTNGFATGGEDHELADAYSIGEENYPGVIVGDRRNIFYKQWLRPFAIKLNRN